MIDKETVVRMQASTLREYEKLLSKIPSSPSGASTIERVKEKIGAKLACLICLSAVQTAHSIWQCSTCSEILHLTCIQRYVNPPPRLLLFFPMKKNNKNFNEEFTHLSI